MQYHLPASPPASNPSRRGVLRWLLGLCAAPLVACGATRRRKAPAVRWPELERRLQGRVVVRGDGRFDTVRRAMVWSARVPDRHPAAIVHAASTDDVVAAVQFAAERGLRVAVRGGGHHFDAPILQDGTLLLDLAGLHELQVDAVARRAIVSPGVTGRDLVAALEPHGLAFPVGHCGSVPLSGYLLNGGFGWNSGAFGPACANIEAVDVVTAAGERACVDAEQDAELFWAVRGAGPRLPVVATRFHLRLSELPRAILTSTAVFDAAHMDAAARWVAEVHRGLPPAVELAALVVSPPPAQREAGAPPRTFVVAATAFAANEAQARLWLEAFDSVPADLPVLDRRHAAPTTFDGLLDGMDGLFPAGHRYASDHLWTQAAPAELLASAREPLLAPPSPRDFVLMAFGPNLPDGAPPLPDMALSVPANVYAGIYAVWQDAGGDEANRGWVSGVGTALAPHAVGRYVGEVDLDANRAHLAACFPPAAQQRLAALRARLDPDDRFACHGAW